MKDVGYKSIVSAILLNHQNEKDKMKCIGLLDQLRDIYSDRLTKHEQILAECIKFQKYFLEVTAHLTPNENLVLYLFNDESCKQYTVNSNEPYRFELGHHTNLKLKFVIARFSGQNKKAILRSKSFLKRLVSLDRRNGDCVQLSLLPLDTIVKKSISLEGHNYTAEIKIIKKIAYDDVPHLDFEDFLEFTRTLYEWDSQGSSSEYLGDLSDCSFTLLHCPVQYFNIPREVLKIIILSIFLVWDCSIRALDDQVISRLIYHLKNQQNFATECEMLKTSLIYLSECVQGEMNDVLKEFSHESLFPPREYHVLKRMNVALKTVVDICVLSIWDVVVERDPSNRLTVKLTQMIREMAIDWVTQEMNSKTNDLKEACLVIHSMWEMIQRNYQSYNLFFHQFNINYIQVSLSTIDEKLESFCRSYLVDRLSQLDSRESEQLEMFTKCTMRFYDTLTSLSNFAKKNRVRNLRLHNYESWFLGVTVFWTYSWREISLKMVERTISLDGSGESTKYEYRRPLPAGLYSFLCIQKGLSDDYAMLSFNHPENLLMGVMSLIHIYSENICAYAKKLYNDVSTSDSEIAERKKQNSSIIRAVNGIEQAIIFIEERWKRFVEWDRMVNLITKEEAMAVDKGAARILASTKERCEHVIYSLLTKYCRTKRDDITRISRSITQDSIEYSRTLKSYMREISSSEQMHCILDAVERLVDEIQKDLLPRCSHLALCTVFSLLEIDIQRYLKKAQQPEYYGNIYMTHAYESSRNYDVNGEADIISLKWLWKVKSAVHNSARTSRLYSISKLRYWEWVASSPSLYWKYNDNFKSNTAFFKFATWGELWTTGQFTVFWFLVCNEYPPTSRWSQLVFKFSLTLVRMIRSRTKHLNINSSHPESVAMH